MIERQVIVEADPSKAAAMDGLPDGSTGWVDAAGLVHLSDSRGAVGVAPTWQLARIGLELSAAKLAQELRAAELAQERRRKASLALAGIVFWLAVAAASAWWIKRFW